MACQQRGVHDCYSHELADGDTLSALCCAGYTCSSWSVCITNPCRTPSAAHLAHSQAGETGNKAWGWRVLSVWCQLMEETYVFSKFLIFVNRLYMNRWCGYGLWVWEGQTTQMAHLARIYMYEEKENGVIQDRKHVCPLSSLRIQNYPWTIKWCIISNQTHLPNNVRRVMNACATTSSSFSFSFNKRVGTCH